jgi:hypothetical protein
LSRHFVVVFNRPTEEIDKLYVESLEAGGAIETAREHYIKKGWEPTVLLCLLSKFDADGNPVTVFSLIRGVCSSHKTLSAAKKAAAACEKTGGAKHTIYKKVAR